MRKILILFFFFFYYACSAQVGYTEKGLASFYGKTFHGKRTADGERFNMNDFTAAHKTLPFNSYLKVTNLRNKRVVYVRINDRGPFGTSRIIDLSRAAAARIGMVRYGMTRVKIEVVDPRTIPKEEKPDPELLLKIALVKKLKAGKCYATSGRQVCMRGYGVEVERFRKYKDAARFVFKNEKKCSERMYILVLKTDKKNKIYRIVAGNFNDRNSAAAALKNLKIKGYNGIIREN